MTLAKVLNIGVYSELEGSFNEKRIKILNLLNLISAFVSVVFTIQNLILTGFEPVHYSIYAFQVLFSLLVFFLQHNRLYVLARFLFVLEFGLILFLNANVFFKGFYGEYLYLIIPVLSLLLFDGFFISLFFLIISTLSFYLPNTLLSIYPSQYFGYFNVCMLFLGVFLIILFFKRENYKKEKLLERKNTLLEKAYSELEIKNKNELALSNLKALKSQMNPHFIFNLLNSIQYMILRGDIENSYNFINQFASLVRNTLDYSDKKQILLSEELQLIKIYLKLEKLRFEDDFEYEIIEHNLKEIKIPPMMIQPFIENALVHGLIHKKGEKRLKITLNITDVLECIIEDNGVGRQKAKKIRQRQRGDHKSFATKSIENRFVILREIYKEGIGYKYYDLDTADSSGMKTKVVLKIPYTS